MAQASSHKNLHLPSKEHDHHCPTACTDQAATSIMIISASLPSLKGTTSFRNLPCCTTCATVTSWLAAPIGLWSACDKTLWTAIFFTGVGSRCGCDNCWHDSRRGCLRCDSSGGSFDIRCTKLRNIGRSNTTVIFPTRKAIQFQWASYFLYATLTLFQLAGFQYRIAEFATIAILGSVWAANHPIFTSYEAVDFLLFVFCTCAWLGCLQGIKSCVADKSYEFC